LRVETAKANLGTAKRPHNAKGSVAQSFEPQVETQLRSLHANLDTYLRAEILGAVVGVPVCYGMNQRATLRAVAQRAGFGEVGLIDESVAAALSCYPRDSHQHHVLVYCLGRAVFSVSVVSVGHSLPRALCHEGLIDLGAQDFDAMLVQSLAQVVLDREGIDISCDRLAMQELLMRAEMARLALNGVSETAIEIGPLVDLGGRRFSGRLRVSRAELETSIAPLVAHTINLSRKAVEGAGVQVTEIAEILLVGEATRTPLVIQEIKRSFGRPARHAPPAAVAQGAAIHATTLRNCFVPRADPQPAVAPTERPPHENTHPPAIASDTAASAAPGPIPQRREPEDAILTALRKIRLTQQSRDWEACIAAFEGLLNQAREELSYAYSMRASELRAAGRFNDAQVKLEMGLECWPENEHIQHVLAGLYADKAWEAARQRLHQRCREYLLKSLRLDPGNASARKLESELARVASHGKHSGGRRGRR
jgi:hypothetical protein